MPDTKTEKSLGGHALMIVGYSDTAKYTYKIQNKNQTLTGFFTARNSRGASCGDQGYYYLPYDYIINQSLTHNTDDDHVIYTVNRTSP